MTTKLYLLPNSRSRGLRLLCVVFIMALTLTQLAIFASASSPTVSWYGPVDARLSLTPGSITAEISVSIATLGSLRMVQVEVNRLRGMDQVTSFSVNGSAPLGLTRMARVATSDDTFQVSFLDRQGDAVAEATVRAETNPSLVLDFTPRPPRPSIQITLDVHIARLAFLNTARVSIKDISGLEGAATFSIGSSDPVAVNRSILLATTETEVEFQIYDRSNEVIFSERIPMETNSELVLTVEGSPRELPPNHVIAGDTAINIDLFFNDPNAAEAHVNRSISRSPRANLLIYLEGSEVMDVFTSEPASAEMIEEALADLLYIIDANNTLSNF